MAEQKYGRYRTRTKGEGSTIKFYDPDADKKDGESKPKQQEATKASGPAKSTGTSATESEKTQES